MPKMRPIIRETVSETFLERVKVSAARVAFQFKPTHPDMGTVGQWREVTFREFHQECRWISYGLMGFGIEKGDRVSILSNTRFEWSLSDMAILGAAAITVPIYASNTATDVAYILEHAEARAVFVEDARQLQKLLDMKSQDPARFPKLEKIIVFEPSAMGLMSRYTAAAKNVVTLQALRELGRREEGRNPSRFDQNLLTAKKDDLITICYTSGTTGVPKGVMLTQGNMMSVWADCAPILERLGDPQEQVLLSFLPFSHIFGKVESMGIYPVGWKEVFAENLDKLMSNMVEIKPTLLFSVPRIFEKAYVRILTGVNSASPTRRKLFHWAFKAGQTYYSYLNNKKNPPLKDFLEYQLAKKLVFKKLMERFGGRLSYAVCGGAPFPKDIAEFFQIIGIQVMEGYGLTETCAPVTLNCPEDIRFGTVGRPLKEVTIKIAEDGEILIQSQKVFQSYYKMPEETGQVLKNGWFATGDIGHLDRDGFLHITDRKKDLIITSGGKNIAPQKIENIAKTFPLVTQFVVHGDRRHYLTALMTLDRDQVIHFAHQNQILFSEYVELIKNSKVIALAQKVIDDVNRQLASYETIKKFVILPNEFSVDSGELTPSMKVRRSFVNRKYQAELDSMYAEPVQVLD